MSFSFCERCKAGNVLAGEPKGTMQDGAYFAAGSDPASSDKAILLLTDIFGLPLVNCKIMADQFAEKAGCDVWVPDLFDGRPPVAESELDGAMPQRPGEKISLFTKLGFFWMMLTRLPLMLNIRAHLVDERVHTFISKIKAEKKYTSIGAVGYCFGGSTTIRLASTDLIKSAVVCHPGQCNAKQFAAMKVPTSWQCAEEDDYFGPKTRNEAEAIFAARKDKPDFVDYEFNEYKGTVHGFATRPKLSIPEAKEGFERSFESTVRWFKKTL